MENYEELETAQIELLHQQAHDQLGDDNCLDVRYQHDSLAAELNKRGVAHDTEIVCPEVETDAPHYRRGFTDDICSTCAFGQLRPYCNLYKFNYQADYVCDSFRYYEVLEFEPPHGFLMANGKQTAYAAVKALDTGKGFIIVSNGEAHGVAEFQAQPVQVKTKEFELETWQEQHRVTPRERRQWWPDAETFYIYTLKSWLPYDGVKLFEDGRVTDEPRLTAAQWKTISTAKELPKQIILERDFVALTDDNKAICGDKGFYTREVKGVIDATFDQAVDCVDGCDGETIPIYSLALVRNPRMRVSKKNVTPSVDVTREFEAAVEKLSKEQKPETMPYEIVKRNGYYYHVIKPNDDGKKQEIKGRYTEGYAHHILNSISGNVKGQRESAWDKIKSRGPRKDIDQMTYFIWGEFKKQFNKNHFAIKDFFDDFIVAYDHEKRFFRVDYTASDNIIFAHQDQWAAVEKYYHPMGCHYKSSFGSGKMLTDPLRRKQEGEEHMPFRIVRRDDEYCVVKINPDDTDGDVSGCHDTEEEAEAQLTALNINVVAEEEGALHDDPKKRKPRKKQAENPQEETFEVPGLDKIITTGHRETQQATEEGPGFLERLKLAAKNIIDIVTVAEKEEIAEDTKLFMNDVGIGQKLVNGELWHFTYSTNAFEDREGETFSTQALENYVSQNEDSEAKGFFNLWHINAEDGHFNTDFAKKEWQGVAGRFLVEAGPYLKDEKGVAAQKFFKNYGAAHPEIAPEGWGCSPEYRYLPEERKTGTYDTIWITRTSTLPKFAAANVWTETRQMNKKRGNKMALSEQQKKAAIEIFGDEMVGQMIQEAEQKTTELEAAGVAHKASTSPTSDETPTEVSLDIEALAAEVGKQFQMDLTPIAETMEAVSASIKALEGRLAKLEETKATKEQTETPRFIFNMKRASEQDGTIVTDADGLKNQKPTEAAVKDGDSWSQVFNK